MDHYYNYLNIPPYSHNNAYTRTFPIKDDASNTHLLQALQYFFHKRQNRLCYKHIFSKFQEYSTEYCNPSVKDVLKLVLDTPLVTNCHIVVNKEPYYGYTNYKFEQKFYNDITKFFRHKEIKSVCRSQNSDLESKLENFVEHLVNMKIKNIELSVKQREIELENERNDLRRMKQAYAEKLNQLNQLQLEYQNREKEQKIREVENRKRTEKLNSRLHFINKKFKEYENRVEKVLTADEDLPSKILRKVEPDLSTYAKKIVEQNLASSSNYIIKQIIDKITRMNRTNSEHLHNKYKQKVHSLNQTALRIFSIFQQYAKSSIIKFETSSRDLKMKLSQELSNILSVNERLTNTLKRKSLQMSKVKTVSQLSNQDSHTVQKRQTLVIAQNNTKRNDKQYHDNKVNMSAYRMSPTIKVMKAAKEPSSAVVKDSNRQLVSSPPITRE